jgi:hypothetical protein
MKNMNLGQKSFSSASDIVMKISCAGPRVAALSSVSILPSEYLGYHLPVESRSDQLDLLEAVLAHGRYAP